MRNTAWQKLVPHGSGRRLILEIDPFVDLRLKPRNGNPPEEEPEKQHE